MEKSINQMAEGQTVFSYIFKFFFFSVQAE